VAAKMGQFTAPYSSSTSEKYRFVINISVIL